MTGIGKGGFVLVSCDDPGAISSDNEEDGRNFAKSLGIPLLEPCGFQEAKEMTKYLFDLSEKLESIVMLRSVTRIAHSRGNVRLDELPKREFKPFFPEYHNLKDVHYTKFAPHPVPPHHEVQLKKLAKCKETFESSPFNWYEGPKKAELMVITCGACYMYTRDVLKQLKLEDKVGILKLGTLYPMPEEFVKKHLNHADKALFVEEVDPFIERNILEMVGAMPASSPRPTFYGKRSGHIKSFGEVEPNELLQLLADLSGVKYQARDAKYAKKATELAAKYVPERGIGYCPGCPHRATMWSVREALKLDGRNGFVCGDIGCYGMALLPTGFSQSRSHFNMGSGTGIANGLGQLGIYGFDQPVLTICGDSTFYHAAMPALVNAVHNGANFTMIIMDNGGTAMTGFQPHPGTDVNAKGEKARLVSMEELIGAMGAKVTVLDPFDLKKTRQAVLDAVNDGGGVKVLIARRPCELMRARKAKAPFKVHVEAEKCIGETCGCDCLCTRVFRCPGLVWDQKSGKAKIDTVICAGCGVCADICPHGAIVKEAA
jgi:indolepyruvate ferredoxin oxidoreductase alpha subunit